MNSRRFVKTFFITNAPLFVVFLSLSSLETLCSMQTATRYWWVKRQRSAHLFRAEGDKKEALCFLLQLLRYVYNDCLRYNGGSHVCIALWGGRSECNSLRDGHRPLPPQSSPPHWFLISENGLILGGPLPLTPVGPCVLDRCTHTHTCT